MKKMITALLVTGLMAAGLVGATAGSASAACQVYTGCVDTKTTVMGPGSVRKGKRATVCAITTAKAGNAKPVGKLRFQIERNRGRYTFSKTVVYSGGKRCVKTGKLRKRGGYSVEVRYFPKPGSVFNPSNDGTGFDVR